jgi:hypothetical protein
VCSAASEASHASRGFGDPTGFSTRRVQAANAKSRGNPGEDERILSQSTRGVLPRIREESCTKQTRLFHNAADQEKLKPSKQPPLTFSQRGVSESGRSTNVSMCHGYTAIRDRKTHNFRWWRFCDKESVQAVIGVVLCTFPRGLPQLGQKAVFW